MQQPDPRALLALAYSQMARGLSREAEETYKKVAAAGSAKRTRPDGSRRRAGLRRSIFRGGSDFPAVGGRRCGGKEHDARGNQALVGRLRASQRGQTVWPLSAADKALQQSTVMAVRFLAARSSSRPAPWTRRKRSPTELAASSEPSDDPRVHGKIIEAQIAMKKKEPAPGDQDSDRRQRRARHLAGALRLSAARTSTPACSSRQTRSSTSASRVGARH